MFLFGHQSKVPQISAADLEAEIGKGKKYHLVDVREPSEYEERHIPGSELRPLGQIQDWHRELPKDEELVLVCRSGNRSGRACDFLQQQGFTNLRNMQGGMIAWQGPVESGIRQS